MPALDLIAGCVVVATAPGLTLIDCADGPDWSEGDPGRYTVGDAEGCALAEFDTAAAAAAAFPALRVPVAVAHLDAWEAEELASAKPCPDLLAWMRDARADLEAHGAAAPELEEVEAFAAHMASLEAEA